MKLKQWLFWKTINSVPLSELQAYIRDQQQRKLFEQLMDKL